MDKLDKWDIAAALIGLFAWFRGEKHSADTATSGGDKQGGKEKVVSILHAFVSKVDESMWLSLITPLNEKQKKAITRLLEVLDRFRERDSFRLTLVNAPVATTIIEELDKTDKTGKKKIKKVVKVGEYSNKDTRVIFLKEIAKLVDDPDWGPEAVRDMLRTHELATESEIAKHALELWKRFLSWMHEVVLEIFGVDNLDKITPDMITRATAGYTNVLARHVPYRRPADMNIGFWRGNYRRYPKSTIGLAISIAGALAWFITLINIAHN